MSCLLVKMCKQPHRGYMSLFHFNDLLEFLVSLQCTENGQILHLFWTSNRNIL